MRAVTKMLSRPTLACRVVPRISNSRAAPSTQDETFLGTVVLAVEYNPPLCVLRSQEAMAEADRQRLHHQAGRPHVC